MKKTENNYKLGILVFLLKLRKQLKD